MTHVERQTSRPQIPPVDGPYALGYLYRNRLRVHAMQELLAGLGSRSPWRSCPRR